jgi:hypothetical protein
MIFSIGVESGAVVPIMSATGLTANADRSFTHIMYQTVSNSRASYVRDIKKGTDLALSFDPVPEKCAWSKVDTITLYCAVSLEYVVPNYLDLWHQGAAAAPDSILSFNTLSGKSLILATPGQDGGVTGDIAELAPSPDGRYLLFITSGDRTLWGLRLQ